MEYSLPCKKKKKKKREDMEDEYYASHKLSYIFIHCYSKNKKQWRMQG